MIMIKLIMILTIIMIRHDKIGRGAFDCSHMTQRGNVMMIFDDDNSDDDIDDDDDE